MQEIIKMTASQLSKKLSDGELSAKEVTQAHLDQISKVDSTINAFLAVNQNALEEAERIDSARSKGEEVDPLAGVPIAIKDVLVTKDMPTTSSSKILEGYMSPFDATVVQKVKHAGLIQLGKTNMDEFAMGATTETSAYGVTHNPWRHGFVPGGSGGGSAASLAAFEAPLAFGSDTGGSIRQPASLTGTVGMKPTYGAVSRYGAISLASSLDQVGPCARTVLDTALLHDVIAGYDPNDGASMRHEWPSMVAAAKQGASGEGLKGLRVGVIKQLQSDTIQKGVAEKFNQSLDWLTAQGAEIQFVDAPHLELAVSTYYVILAAEASSNLAKFDSVRFGLRVAPENASNFEDVMSATRGQGFGTEVKRRILLGIHALSAGNYDRIFVAAQKARRLVANDLFKAFEQVDVLVNLTGPTTAWGLGEKSSDPMQNYLKDAATIPANLAGIPGISLPLGLAAEDGMPVGIQLLADTREDAILYSTAAALETMVKDRDGSAVWERVPAAAGKDN